jgi:hypothetical protein
MATEILQHQADHGSAPVRASAFRAGDSIIARTFASVVGFRAVTSATGSLIRRDCSPVLLRASVRKAL